MGRPEKRVIHMAGGRTHITVDKGQRHFFEEHRFTERSIEEVRHDLRREPCELVEFHCMLVRSEVLERLGPLDEGLMSQAEHSDLCLLVREEGGTVYFEPEAAVTYVTSGPWRWSDYPFFVRRWSRHGVMRPSSASV
jgi:GT2 family glycosyltransferase